MFNNFICEKKSKFKTKGKIVITKKTNHQPRKTISDDSTRPNPDQNRPKVTQTKPDPGIA